MDYIIIFRTYFGQLVINNQVFVSRFALGNVLIMPHN